MDQKKDYKEAYEKGKLHTRYLLIIGCIFAIIGVSLALGGNSDALGQISMASTVSSIILSAIAIFMSISGENKLTYTHSKLLETSDRMSDIAANIERANSLLDNTINYKLLKIDDIFEQLEQIGQSVDNVEKEMLNSTLHINKESNINFSSDTIWNLYIDMINRLDENNAVIKITKEVIPYVVICRLEKCLVHSDNVEKYLQSELGDMNSFYKGLAVGIICVFGAMGISKDENIAYFEQKMELSEDKRNKIKKFM